MASDPVLGLTLITLAGIATACFYAPFKQVRGWAWETYWLAFGVTSWVVGPWLAAWLTVPQLGEVLSDAPGRALAMSFIFGALWGVGSLTNGLALRYLGLSLGWAIPLGLCAALGTLLPPAVSGEFPQLLQTSSGRMTLVSVAVGLVGIAICAKAGSLKDRELSMQAKREAISEFNLGRGLWLSVVAGVMSACMAFGIAEGKPIAAVAIEHGAAEVWQNTPLFAVLLLGGFATNAAWCLVLGIRHRTARQLAEGPALRLSFNYLLCTLAGALWYLQSLFYGMGETKMGRYRFAGWSVLMACIIIFSNLWGLAFREWAGTSRTTRTWLAAGLAVLVLSALMTSYGSYLATYESY
ncbi:MAG: rhamnose/proton symporter RhaT [Planctomycetota bacterium]|nr:MAG: rhamnose/proton symporter RhaT [Planctomycetota bacterium]